MLFLVYGAETILDVLCVIGADKYSNANWGKAKDFFKERYPNCYGILLTEVKGDLFTIEASRAIKDIVEAEGKLMAESLFLARHPTARNKKNALFVYTIEEWQGIKI